MTQPSAKSFTLTKLATYCPSKMSLKITMAPWPFTSIPIPPVEKISPKIKNPDIMGQIFPTLAVYEAKQLASTKHSTSMYTKPTRS